MRDSDILAGALLLLLIVISGAGYITGIYFMFQFALASAFWPFFCIGMVLVLAIMLLKLYGER